MYCEEVLIYIEKYNAARKDRRENQPAHKFSYVMWHQDDYTSAKYMHMYRTQISHHSKSKWALI